MLCHRCGHRNPSGANFCSSCGTALGTSSDTTLAFVPVEPQAEAGEDEIGFPLSELAEGTGVLVVKQGPDAGARFLLKDQVTTVGRHPDSDIFLDDITVSRRHAELERLERSYVIRDVGSLNGTYVNRQRTEESALAAGDEVQIGKFKLIFFAPAGN
jgi:pSer/pThr/pTyr-binding forkhead associated (FHA) protein